MLIQLCKSFNETLKRDLYEVRKSGWLISLHLEYEEALMSYQKIIEEYKDHKEDYLIIKQTQL